MTIDQRIADYYQAIVPGSFASIPFGVRRGSISGGFDVADETRFGQGTVVHGLQASNDRLQVDAYITGADALARAKALRRAFRAGEGTLVFPWEGSVQAICIRHDLNWESESLEWVEFSAEFALTVLPEQEQTQAPTSASAATESIILLGRDLADSPAALAQMETLRPLLTLEPSGQTGADYTEQVTDALISSPSRAEGEVPSVLAELGQGLQTAERGELLQNQALALEARLLLHAERYDATALLDMREQFMLFVGPFGGGVLAQQQIATGSTLQGISVNTGIDLDVLAQRNRAAISRWFAIGRVQV